MYRFLCAFLFALCLALPAHGQRLTIGGDAGLTLWPTQHEHYQNTLSGSGAVTGHWGRVSLEVHAGLTMWGSGKLATDKDRPTPAMAEWLKVLDRTQGARLLVDVGRWSVGAEVLRQQVHHVWLHRSTEHRHDYFPIETSWRGATRRCNAGLQSVEGHEHYSEGGCPSIGYWERAGLRIEHEGRRHEIGFSFLPIQYKTLTLPPVLARANASVRREKWTVRTELELTETRRLYGQVSVGRCVADAVSLAGWGGYVRAPDWTSRFWASGVRVGTCR